MSYRPAPAATSFRGALVTKSADETAANYSTGAMIGWDSEAYDTDGIHDNATNNSRLTVPAGVTRARFGFQVHTANMTGNINVFGSLYKNGGQPAEAGICNFVVDTDNTTPRGNAWTPVMTVAEGDYFEVRLTCSGDTSITIVAGLSWFAMEIVE